MTTTSKQAAEQPQSLAPYLCPCEEWVKQQPIPGKVIGFRCSRCNTEYTLFPNGEIMFSQIQGGLIATGN